MKKILMSVGMIAFVAALSYGATGAFFSDSETSTANVFTAGAIDLKVDSQAHYNHMVCVPRTDTVGYYWQPEANFVPDANTYPTQGSTCDGTWTLTDLGPTNHFFNFSDVKPGDQGEDTVSLHIDNNPAWACADIKVTKNDENVAINPELKAGDIADDLSNNFDGELAQNINVFAWNDNGAGQGGVAGDNIWQAGEPALYGPVSAFSTIGATTTLPLADSVTNGGVPLAPGDTNHVGFAWCAGTMTANAGVITCNGASMGNNAQTDAMTADVTFRVEQSRNNGAFKCVAPIVVTANTLSTTGADANWYFFDDSVNVINNTLGTFVAGPATPPTGTGSALVNPLTSAADLSAGSRTYFANGGFGGTTLASISALSYSYYQPSGAWSVNEAPFLRFNVNFAGAPAYQGSLVWVPNTNGVTGQDAWKNSGNLASAGSLWVYSRSFWPAGNVSNGSIPGTTARTWSAILADYPSATMHALFPQIGLRVGEPGPVGLTANLDNFSITISGVTKTYDFGN